MVVSHLIHPIQIIVPFDTIYLHRSITQYTRNQSVTVGNLLMRFEFSIMKFLGCCPDHALAVNVLSLSGLLG